MMPWQKINDGRDWDWPVLYDSDDFRNPHTERLDWARIVCFLVLAGAVVAFWVVVILAVLQLVGVL